MDSESCHTAYEFLNDAHSSTASVTFEVVSPERQKLQVTRICYEEAELAADAVFSSTAHAPTASILLSQFSVYHPFIQRDRIPRPA